jgi:hypothetical protein
MNGKFMCCYAAMKDNPIKEPSFVPVHTPGLGLSGTHFSCYCLQAPVSDQMLLRIVLKKNPEENVKTIVGCDEIIVILDYYSGVLSYYHTTLKYCYELNNLPLRNQ